MIIKSGLGDQIATSLQRAVSYLVITTLSLTPMAF